MQLELLAKRLPALLSQPLLEQSQGEAFDVSPQVIDGYVSPTISIIDWPENASVLLIEAPGAVGKSAAATALAHHLNWPLIRAERAQVGDYTLLGLIQDALGITGTYVRDIALAEAGVVIDSLDEAHLKAGTENFLAFIKNVMKVSGSQILPEVRPPSVVLFSRIDTAELVELAFADQSVPLARARLEFFDLKASRDFIASYLRLRFCETMRPEYNVALASPRPFEKLRDGRMTQIGKVLLAQRDVRLDSAWEEVKDFLGYAPVLIALAESLAVTNPAAQVRELEATDEGRLLREIVNFILVREQSKFVEHLVSKLHAMMPADQSDEVGIASIYAPQEQAIRLLGRVSGVQVATSLPATLPQAVRVQYEEAVDTFLPDHPFLKGSEFASLVFEDFVASIVTANLEARLALGENPQLLVENIGPFFARFLGQVNGADEVELPESAIENVLWSWAQEAELAGTSDTDVRLALMNDGAFLLCSRKEGGAWVDLEFVVTDLTGALAMRRPLRRVNIVTDFGLILGSRTGHLQLGPEVLVLAEELIIESETIRVVGENVRLGAETCVANHLSKIESGAESLSVYFDEQPPNRLRPYLRSLRLESYSVPYQAFVDLRSVFGCFRSTIHHGLCVPVQVVDNRVIRSSERRRRILDQLISKGIVAKNGGWYELDVNALSRVGFGLQDLRAGHPSDAVLGFLVHGGHGEQTFEAP
ncbi:MAG: hypothetical protein ACRDS9_05635 [Pseudonocardiaceae bacterium]